MPSSSYAALPTWLQLVLILGAVAAALVGLIALIHKMWTLVTRTVHTLENLELLPKFMEETKATLKAQDEGAIIRDRKIEEIHHEVNYNNGSSVKDAISRVEDGVAGLYRRADTTDQNASDLRDDLENTKPVIRRRKPPQH